MNSINYLAGAVLSHRPYFFGNAVVSREDSRKASGPSLALIFPSLEPADSSAHPGPLFSPPGAVCCRTKKIEKKLDKQSVFSIIITILNITSTSKLPREGNMVTRKGGKKYKTNEICARFDISRATLFRWESEGLLANVERDWRGWRVYNESNLKSIEKIMKNKNAG
jgi:MerR family regulatory protein